ncbi:nucleotide exchange factor GrpE [Candidatus Roizmanbacteria bacterium RIFCSPHIGHO2_01_FULL_39_12b]|uniref:Protein GrpE n=1 Tax=Candidatus Roizmanbacteria bacterium RIFCSPHIGHO2_01_FULL_39_12b TaxID=1802030 RepID=A0A1F7GBZ5_9BACT|nr:MAG: nucleotide exchange factor GrpE [Candidatus Roizmanbacteria bacterium RIFCSPHIGHO2_01_FULL_39_12b]OGK46115.1 MAG: nucleotide exchange factor GrpE [Candidatus Roizmanbacteria bacterium RIFCSPLOWO2_01_FULL_39_19]
MKKGIKDGQKPNEIDALKQNYLRALADYQNLERRTNEQIGQIRHTAGKHLLLQLLDVVDDVERAEVFVNDEGLSHVRNKLLKILEDSGVKQIEVLGQEFDPNVAECIELVEGKENRVIKELQKGYTLHGEVLRTAKVAVGRS